MTDKELLELAAKAAGYEKVQYKYRDAGYHIPEECCVRHWNPLTDDGDALRLAMKLGLLVDVRYGGRPGNKLVRVTYWIDPLKGEAIDIISDDQFAATRRAITRAAAEIGKMKGEM